MTNAPAVNWTHGHGRCVTRADRQNSLMRALYGVNGYQRKGRRGLFTVGRALRVAVQIRAGCQVTWLPIRFACNTPFPARCGLMSGKSFALCESLSCVNIMGETSDALGRVGNRPRCPPFATLNNELLATPVTRSWER